MPASNNFPDSNIRERGASTYDTGKGFKLHDAEKALDPAMSQSFQDGNVEKDLFVPNAH